MVVSVPCDDLPYPLSYIVSMPPAIPSDTGCYITTEQSPRGRDAVGGMIRTSLHGNPHGDDDGNDDGNDDGHVDRRSRPGLGKSSTKRVLKSHAEQFHHFPQLVLQ